MKIILHIILKDLHRHRLEIAGFVLACAAWAWQQTHPMTWHWLRQRELVVILLFGLWFFITVRIVQGESLVGDREFWRTRPYQWGHLMAAKALVLGLCLNVPFLAAQIYMLALAEIPLSLRLVPGLIFLQLIFAFFLTFPAAVLAALTETIVQWVLAMAGLAIYALVLSWFPWDKLQSPLAGGETVATLLGASIIVPALTFALLWQYARRRVWAARLTVGVSLLSIPLCILVAPTQLVKLIAYPRAPAIAPLEISTLENREEAKREYTRTKTEFTVTDISIPIMANSLDSNTIVSIDGYRVVLSGDHGWNWESEWQNKSIKLSSDEPVSAVSFGISNKVADQMRQAHPVAKLELALETYRLDRPVRVDTAVERFSLPGNVSCHWLGEAKDIEVDGSIFSIGEREVCNAPLLLPGVIRIRIDSGSSTCPVDKDESPIPPDRFATDLTIGNSTTPADFDPDPVRRLDLRMGLWLPPVPRIHNPQTNVLARLCRGTPLVVSIGKSTGRMRATFDLGSIGEEKLVHPDTERILNFIPESR